MFDPRATGDRRWPDVQPPAQHYAVPGPTPPLPPGGPPAGRHRTLRTVLGLVAAASMLLATAVVAVLARDEDETGPAAAAPRPSAQGKTKEPDSSVDHDEPLDRPEPLLLGTAAIGETFTLGQYDLRVNAVTLDATELIRQTAQYDRPPQGQYALLEVSFANVSDRTGYPGLDVEFIYTGADAQEHSSDDCAADLFHDWTVEPILPPGRSQLIQACVDVPPGQVDGGRLSVQDWFTGERVDISGG